MGVFKNDVGRPSNEVLRTRKILKIVGSVVLLGGCFVLGYFGAKKVSENGEITEKQKNNKESNLIIEDNSNNNSIEINYNDTLHSLKLKVVGDKHCLYLDNNVIYYVDAPSAINNIYQIDDLLALHIISGDVRGQEIVFIDFKGKVVKEVGDFIEGNVLLNISTEDDNISVSNRIVTIKTTALTHGNTMVLKDGSDVDGTIPYDENIKSKYNITDKTLVKATYILEYFGDKKFSEILMTESTMYGQYIKENESTSLDINSKEVLNLYMPFAYHMYEASNEELYKSDKVTVSDLSSEYKNRLAFAHYYNDVSKDELYSGLKYLKSSVLKKYYEELFGKTVKYESKTIPSYGISSYDMPYDTNVDGYYLSDVGGDATPYRYGNELYKAIKKDNKIELYQYVVVYNEDYLKGIGGVYRNINDANAFTNPIKETTSGVLADGFIKYKYKQISSIGVYLDDLADYKEQASQYKLTFEKENDNYVFKYIEKIK